MDNGPTPRPPAEPLGVATASASERPDSDRAADYAGVRVPAGVPLGLILVVQALLSLRLVKADSAFQDEAAYLWAGHLEWAHWLHGTPIPPFPAYFSGAPVIYPPLGALADNLGGLAAARILSLLFMLGTTVVLYFVARRLFGRQAAFFAAILFAISGPTLHLGSFATFDAMATFLVAVAVLFVVRAGGRKDAAASMIIAAVVLALANATSYSTAIFDPVVILLALVLAFPRPGGRLAAGRSLIMLAVLAAVVCIGMLIGGSAYLHGINTTTVQRAPGSDPALTVLTDAWAWTGVIVVVALCGVAVSYITREKAPRIWLLALLDRRCAADAGRADDPADVGLAEQARRPRPLVRHHGGRICRRQAHPRFARGKQPNRDLRRLRAGPGLPARARHPAGACLRDRLAELPRSRGHPPAVPGPDLGADPGRGSGSGRVLPAGESQWKRWSSTRNIVLATGGSTGGPSKAAGVVGPGDPAAFARFIAEGYFTLVALNFQDTTPLDHSIVSDLHKSGDYKIVSVIPYGPARGTYVIYRYEPHL